MFVSHKESIVNLNHVSCIINNGDAIHFKGLSDKPEESEDLEIWHFKSEEDAERAFEQLKRGIGCAGMKNIK